MYFIVLYLIKKEAKRKGKYMKYTVSYDSEELINEVTQDGAKKMKKIIKKN